MNIENQQCWFLFETNFIFYFKHGLIEFLFQIYLKIFLRRRQKPVNILLPQSIRRGNILPPNKAQASSIQDINKAFKDNKVKCRMLDTLVGSMQDIQCILVTRVSILDTRASILDIHISMPGCRQVKMNYWTYFPSFLS